MQAQCFGNRNYTEVTVQTFSRNETASDEQKSFTLVGLEEPSSIQTIASGSNLSSKATNEGSG